MFEHNYATAPVCAPSRFALITGTHAESSMPGINMRALPPNGFANMPDFIVGWPTYLREAGYYTTNNAKTDYNAIIDMEATWDESSNEAHYDKRPEGANFFAIFNYETTHENNRRTTNRMSCRQIRKTWTCLPICPTGWKSGRILPVFMIFIASTTNRSPSALPNWRRPD